MLNEKLKDAQPLVYEAISKAISTDSISHAYLFYGPSGTYKTEAAYLLAMSLFCQHNDPLACEECEQCQNIKDGNNVDFTVLDGYQKSISKKDVDDLQKKYATTSQQEGHGHRCYIILNADNSSLAAMNSMLKFLEEPAREVIAILTSDNINRLLPTIVSRCTLIPFSALSVEHHYQQALTQGIDQENAFFLARLVKSDEDIVEASQSEAYKNSLMMFRQWLDDNGPASELLVDYDISYKQSVKSENMKMVTYFMMLVNNYGHDVINESKDGPHWYQSLIAKAKGQKLDYAHLIILINNLLDKCNKYNDLNLLMAETYEQLEKFKYELR